MILCIYYRHKSRDRHSKKHSHRSQSHSSGKKHSRRSRSHSRSKKRSHRSRSRSERYTYIVKVFIFQIVY